MVLVLKKVVFISLLSCRHMLHHYRTLPSFSTVTRHFEIRVEPVPVYCASVQLESCSPNLNSNFLPFEQITGTVDTHALENVQCQCQCQYCVHIAQFHAASLLELCTGRAARSGSCLKISSRNRARPGRVVTGLVCVGP